MDAACIFSDVLVPWNRVFFYGDVTKANALYNETHARHHTGHQGIIRALAKAELIAGVAVALARSANLDSFLHVQEMLCELLGYIELVKGAILLSESDASMTEWGTLSPAINPIQSLRYHFPRMYARVIEIVQTLGGGSLLSSPIERDFNGLLTGYIDRYFRGAEKSAFERVGLLKLAWDITGDSFGQRQLLYERYHAGDPVRLAAALYTGSNIDHLLEITKNAVSRCL
jgi:4-hydroxyphenylacetate 3-monooxygenase/anthranilate 3-monooxygenase (FAD)/4-hydroxyphenylacetate 3-monooxygenase